MKKMLRAIWEPLICAIFVPIILAAEAWHRRQERKFYGHDDRMIRSVDALLDKEEAARHEATVSEALEAEKAL